MIYEVINVQEAGMAKTARGDVPRYELELKDEKGAAETATAWICPKVGEYISGIVEVKEVNGRYFRNFISDKKVQHVAPVGQTSYQKSSYSRDKFDFTKEEKVENDKRQSSRIARQGFMNQAMAMRPHYKTFKDWYEVIVELEPIYQMYVETGELPVPKEEKEKK